MTAFFGSVSLALWKQRETLSPEAQRLLIGPLGREDWKRLLALSLQAACSCEEPPPLIDVFARGAHTAWLVGSSSQAASPARVLQDWLRAAAAFFSQWRLDTRQGRTVLVSAAHEIDLAPFLQIADCPDCDATAVMFFYDGVASAGRIRCRSLHSGHCLFRAWEHGLPLQEPAGANLAVDVERMHPAFHEDATRLAPAPMLGRMRRMISEGDHAYILLCGADGVGKTYTARFLAEDPQLVEEGYRVAYVAAPPREETAAAVWLQEFDEALRAGGGHLRLPDAAYARALVGGGGSAERQMRSYLAALVRINGGPVVVIIDDLQNWPQSAPYWPVELPSGVFLLLVTSTAELAPPLQNRMESLLKADALRLSMTAADVVCTDLVAQWMGRGASAAEAGGSFLQVRLRDGAARCGFDAVEGGPFAWTADARNATVLLRLAAAAGAVPLRQLVEWTGAEAWRVASHQVGFLMRFHADTRQVELAHPSIITSLRETCRDAYRDACRQLAWWASQELTAGDSDNVVARDGLWRWLVESQDTALAVRVAGSQPLVMRMRELADTLSPQQSLRLMSSWYEALQPLTARDYPLVSADLSLLAARLRGQTLLRVGAHAEAWQVCSHAVSVMTEMLRDGNTEVRSTLAEGLVLRGRAALQRDIPSLAVEDCTRAVELYEIEQTRPDREVEPAAIARARWALGQALMANDNLSAAVFQMEQAASLMREAGCHEPLPALYDELARLYLQAGRSADAEQCCAQALQTGASRGAAEQAATLGRRALALGMLGKAEEAAADLQQAVDLYQALLEEGRHDLMPAAAQALFDLGVLFGRSGRAPAAVTQLTAAIDLYQVVVEEHGQLSCRPLLARAYNERGLLRTRVGNIEEAVEDCTRAIDMSVMLLERERRSHLRSDLARAYNNRAQAFTRRGETEHALRDYQQALSHYEVLISRQHRNEFRHHVALVHYNEGGLYRKQRDYEQARREYTVAADMLGALRSHGDSPELARDLAAALANRGLVGLAQGHAEDAHHDYLRAVELLAPLRVGGVGRELAAAFLGRGRARLKLSMWASAVEDFEAAVDLYRAAPTSGDAELLAGAMLDRGRAHLALRSYAAAAADFHGCIAFAEAVPTDMRALLAAAWTERGRALRGTSGLTEARAAFDSAVDLYENTPQQQRDEAWRGGITRALHERGMLRLKAEGGEAALADLDAAARWYHQAGNEDGLARLRNDRCRVFFAQKRFEEVLAEAEMTVHTLSHQHPSSTETERVLAEALSWKGRSEQASGRVSGAIASYTRSIAAYSRLAEEARDLELCADLARTYSDRAAAQRMVGSGRNALVDYDWTVDLFRELMALHGKAGLEGELGNAHAARGYILLEMGRPQEALRDLEAAQALGARVEAGSGELLTDAVRRCQNVLEEYKTC